MEWIPTTQTLIDSKDIILASNLEGKMISMGVSQQEFDELKREELRDSLESFMLASHIPDEEYKNVLNFYQKTYAHMKDEHPSTRNDTLWNHRLEFLERCKKQDIHWTFSLHNMGYTFVDNNVEVIKDIGAICLLVSNTALWLWHRSAHEKALETMNSDMYNVYAPQSMTRKLGNKVRKLKQVSNV
tara:strand:- start:196 stop:753 length:558 start_codon:yes stop_codon:yes gene_type:complete